MIFSFNYSHRPSLRLVSVGAAAFAFALATPRASASGFSIVATFDSSITSLSNASDVESTINSVLALYNSKFNSNVTVNINFSNMGSGLGASSTFFTSESTSDYLTALAGHNSGDAIDTAAQAKLASNPYAGSTIALSTANARALGFSAAEATDGFIGLNTSLCFTGHSSPVGGKYDLYAVAAHEIDEVLGTSSGVGRDFQDADLFRYDGSGHRSFTSSSAEHAYFSVDGTTLLEEYNQFGRTGGDFGDWAVHNPAQVQDFQGTPGVLVDPGEGEFALLDAIGYTSPNSTPEPGLIALIWVSAIPLVRKKLKKRSS